jgi:lipopolysaccharide export system permease protein
VFGTILFRMILWELFKVFFISLVAITGILLMAGIIAEASQQGLGPTQILAAIPLLVPSTLPYTIPATTLFAACIVYGRLAADNEILAIRAAGINIVQVVRPGLILGVVMSVATVGLYYHVIPYSHYLLREMIFHDAEELIYSVLRRHGALAHAQMPYSMFVKGVQGKKLISPVFKRKGPKGQIDVVAHAREAELRVDTAKKLLMIHMRFGVATHEDGSRAYFEDRYFDVPLPEGFGHYENRRARDMTWQELLEREEELREELVTLAEDIEEAQKQIATGKHRPDLPKHAKNLGDRVVVDTKLLRILYVERMMRLSLSFGCLCFILVGSPVGIWFSRSDYLSAFITCFLPIVVVYYPLLLCGTNMAKEDRFEPLVLIWAANATVGTVGLGLFWRLLKN